MGRSPDFCAQRASISPHDIAFEDFETGDHWSYARVDAAARSLGAVLIETTEPGARIAILCHNRPEFFVALFACLKTGRILAPLNWRQPVPELSAAIASIRCSLVLHDGAMAETAPLLGVPHVSLDSQGAADLPPHSIDEDAPWFVLFTSGTTGTPKAVIQTPRMVAGVAMNLAQAMGLSARDRTVNYLPLFHTAGINLFTMPLFLWGGCSIVMRRFEERVLLDLLTRKAITQFFGVPTIYQSLAEILPVDMTLDHVRGWACGGAALPEALITKFARHGAVIRNGFGMTESGPTGFLIDEQGALARIGSVGKPLMMTEARLAGVRDGHAGQGELLMRGPTVSPGYLDNPEATRATMTDDGWLKSGDIAARDAEGYYRIVDRIKDMYISGGENVYPAEVERALIAHPDVTEAAVIGVPDDQWGESGAAFLSMRKGADLTANDLALWLRTQIAAYKVPKTWRVVDAFPRTPAGKIRKTELRSWLP